MAICAIISRFFTLKSSSNIWMAHTFQAIDDDDISCPLPSRALEGNKTQHTFRLSVWRHAQLASEIFKRLNSEKAKRQIASETLATVCDLEKKLQEWRACTPIEFWSRSSFLSNLPDGLQSSHNTFLSFCYLGSLITIHSPFCYPWSRPWPQNEQSPAVLLQRQRSTEIVADSARCIIKATQRMQMNAASPVW